MEQTSNKAVNAAQPRDRTTQGRSLPRTRAGWLAGAALGIVLVAPACAQNPAEFERRDLFYQQQILDGLRSGRLTAHEAGRLQHESARIDRFEAQALRDGRLSEHEAARIRSEQQRLGHQIARQMNDGQTGDPQSSASRRLQEQMQHEIRRDQAQLHQLRSGQLNYRDLARQEWQDGRNAQGRPYPGQRFSRDSYRDHRFGSGAYHGARSYAEQHAERTPYRPGHWVHAGNAPRPVSPGVTWQSAQVTSQVPAQASTPRPHGIPGGRAGYFGGGGNSGTGGRR